MKKILFFILIFLYLKVYPEKIFINSIPKCGTHLLDKCIRLLTLKKAKPIGAIEFYNFNQRIEFDESKEFLLWHVHYSEYSEQFFVNNKFKCLFIFRDPRDQIISHIFWGIENNIQLPYIENKTFRDFNINKLLNMLIENIDIFYKMYLPWMEKKFYHSVKFENLVGPKGFGSDKAQKEEIKNICNFLNIEPYNKLILNCAANLFGDTNSFRDGAIGKWKKYFTEQHKQLFKEKANSLLIKLGYEKDLNW